ncbi:MFS general substrate transporter [Rhizodiscina lignyota]|uniref:Efflux pump dotC n=1 Tax=Rhizodiscina lignyota TaxID=1504668 RepID=A0A9P4M6F3_9PEZI|nr:MFS general substrate transporter [Rhizodiscina lignyota]
MDSTEDSTQKGLENGVFDKEAAVDESSTEDQEQNAPVKAEPQEAQKPRGHGPTEEEEKSRGTGRIALIMFALGMAVFLAALDMTIITTALPTITEHFHSASGYIWIGAAYQLAASASTPLWGKISDIWGRKPTLLIANFIFFVGSLVAAVAVNMGMLIAGRAIQGWGGGGLLVLVNITIGDLFSMRSRGAYYGIIGMVWAIASALGPIIGGAFTDKVSWRWCFYINLPLDGIAFLIILFVLNLQTPTTPFWEGVKVIDWVGALTIVGGTLMLLFGLEFGGVTFPWNSATVICLIVFGIVTMGLFFLNEWKFAKYPIMPLYIFKYRSNCAALLVCFIHAYVFISGSYFMPLYFQASRSQSPLMSGVDLLGFVLALSLSSAATGIFIRKTGKYLPPIWFGMVVLTLGFGLFIDLDAHSSWVKVIWFEIVAGLGVGPNFQSPLIALQSLVQPRDIGSATATFQFTRNLGVAISIVIGGVVFQNQMLKKADFLAKELGPEVARQLGGNNAGANTAVVNRLPPAQKNIAQETFASSLRPDWIMYCAFAGFGLLVSLLITKQKLTKSHEVTKTGLEAEKERRRMTEEDKARKKAGTPKEGKEDV